MMQMSARTYGFSASKGRKFSKTLSKSIVFGGMNIPAENVPKKLLLKTIVSVVDLGDTYKEQQMIDITEISLFLFSSL